MNVEFVSPNWLWLLLALPLLWWQRKWVSKKVCALRTLVLTLVVVALAQPQWLTQSGSPYHSVIIDFSASVSASYRPAILDKAQQLLQSADEVHSQLVLISHSPRDREVFSSQAPWAAAYKIHTADTLSQALDMARLAIPAGAKGQVSLISDGLANRRQWQQTIAEYRSTSLALNTVVVPVSRPQPVITDVILPAVSQGELATVQVTLEGASDGVNVEVYAGDTLLSAAQQLVLQTHTNVSLTLPQQPVGVTPINVVLTEDQQTLDTMPAVVVVQPARQVVLVEPEGEDSRDSVRALLGEWARVKRLTPTQLQQVNVLEDADTLILHNIAADTLSDDAQQRIEAAVRNQGLALVVSGDGRSFQQLSDASSRVRDLLPVSFTPPEKIAEPSVALAIIIDSSGSMEGEPMALAKKAARLAVRHLKPNDYVGIVEFYGNKQWAVPMQPVGESNEVERAIGRMQASGGTVLFPAIQEAYYGLKAAPTRYKHMLMITDAGVEEDNYQQLLRYITKDRINVSTVLVGAGATGSEKMQQLADWGQGRFYAIEDNFSLVELDLRQQQPKPQPIYQQGQFGVTMTQSSMSQYAIPPVLGYAKTRLKPAAFAFANIEGSDAPLVAQWSVGAGQVMVMTTDYSGAGSRNWQQWQNYSQWFSSLIQSITIDTFPYQISQHRGEQQVSLQVVKQGGSALGEIGPTLQLMPDAEALATPLALHLRAPGWYETAFTYPQDKSLSFILQAGARKRYSSSPAFEGYFQEHHVPAEQQLPMAQLSAQTGGISMALDASLNANEMTRLPATNWQSIQLQHWLALLALGVFFIELIMRRLPQFPSRPLKENQL